MSPRIVIIGGGPGGYEAALVATKAGADVTLVERHGLGGNAVLTDVVPSKTVIATAEWLTIAGRASELGIRRRDGGEIARDLTVDMGQVNARVKALVRKQSGDIAARLEKNGVDVLTGVARLDGPHRVAVGDDAIDADAVLLAVGARPRVVPGCEPDGERILTWTQLYDLDALPEHLIVVGSGVTGAEFAGAYRLLGSEVTLVASKDRVLAREDPDASAHLTRVFVERGMHLVGGRAARVERTDDGVAVTLEDGSVLEGSHCLMAVGSVPNTEGIGLEEAGVELDERGLIRVDRVSRTTARSVYAAGDCTGVLPLASVAATQGRIAMAHTLGDAVTPLDLGLVASNVFTVPEIAAVGASEAELKARGLFYEVSTLDLARNPRAKMLGIDEGFIKVFGHTVTGQVFGAVIVGPRASEHIYPLSLAVAHHLTVDDVAAAFTVYPSLSGTLSEAARRLHRMGEGDARA
ncbi:NAD(P)H-quinone dehydrogenase [Demequina lignilytica]|uniref:NAD(P)H-quinone dehydrogenase n=1 Tax=Demequina lignilytica TaxID=3051663 RepID=A0AB35MGT2_9MICO|nr:NAD(P)H-quinone dehydrogenase [Demequina sp. SYSU T0a273]MDN4482976.1 NAD(P)H-quinone dehydrogenase [Demequina sp. SYSU T0a273]